MQVFKFGGASINTVDRIKQVAQIIKANNSDALMVIISAMGKTTNGLEKVAEAFFDGRTDDALALFQQVKNQHLTMAKYLLVLEYNACAAKLSDFFTEAEWLLHDKPVREYDYYYDQIVSIGELLSTCIVSHYLTEIKLTNTWLDVRDIFRTDQNFRDANIDWKHTKATVEELVKPLLVNGAVVITQGFIGSSSNNESTTLGREGSDYSAAIFANLLNAKNQTIWKDVPSVMNADPKQFADAIALPILSYEEVIEMAYYGAQVIHPKTIKPLYEKQIPLLVKCFLDASLPGTIISNGAVKNMPPVFIVKENQVLMEFRSKDYSFVGEQSVGHLYHLLESLNIKPNLTQNGAISFMAVFDNRIEKLEQLALQASDLFEVQMRKSLTLITIRHYTASAVQQVLGQRTILLEQKTPSTIQAVCLAQSGN